MNYGKVLGVAVQAMRGIRRDCPSLNLVLNKKMPFPSIIRARSGD